MFNIDTDQVLNGTFHKQLIQGYNKMKTSGLTEESALEYKKIYENASLSDILSESELIFSEPLKGLGFMTGIITESKIPLYEFKEQRQKLNNFMTEHSSQMGLKMMGEYKAALTKIDEVMKEHAREIEFSSYLLTEDTKSKISEMCDDLYEYGTDGKIPSVESFFANESLENKILYGYYVLFEYDENLLSKILHENMVVTESFDADPDVHRNTIRANILSSYLTEDHAILERAGKVRNKNLNLLVKEAVYEDYSNIINDVFTEYVDEDAVDDFVGEDAVMEMFEDDRRSEWKMREFLETRLTNAAKAKDIYEAALDITFNAYIGGGKNETDPTPSTVSRIIGREMTIKESMDYLIEKVNYMDETMDIILESDEPDDAFFEYTRRGEATPTIRKQTGNIREGLASSGGKQNTQNNQQNEEDDDDDEEEEKQTSQKPVQKSQKPVENTSNEEEDEESIQDRPKDKNGKPMKQKQSLTRKIQDKAIDMDVKAQKAAGNVKQHGTELKNAAKAVLRLPGNILKSMKTGIEEWFSASEEKRKELILKPGYRTQVFKLLKTAIMYGAVWSYKKYMVIVLYICRHTFLKKISTESEKRLRNELTAELETEIAVTEEKINDANSNGDQKQKYELIRIKKKLEAEKTRVSANTKFI